MAHLTLIDRNMKLHAYDPAKQKLVLVGQWSIEESALIRDVDQDHFMNVVQGYGIQEVAFQKVLSIIPKIKYIIFNEVYTGDRLTADIPTWLEHSKVMDFGHGKQRFLSVKFMKREKNGK